jgi:hypothetical protein
MIIIRPYFSLVHIHFDFWGYDVGTALVRITFWEICLQCIGQNISLFEYENIFLNLDFLTRWWNKLRQRLQIENNDFNLKKINTPSKLKAKYQNNTYQWTIMTRLGGRGPIVHTNFTSPGLRASGLEWRLNQSVNIKNEGYIFLVLFC